ncbi:amino acid adenylation domain-containing protein [Pseudomonas gozinkensis]|uniref:amino acid adenylation domain-containing protein n=1 Tax=Pseudomonas gozinkensis TaxID=2774461 RepID=UPI0017887A34|nr:amino acid adenylation domain-containing protein [Pseudomonas gozinkensis]
MQPQTVLELFKQNVKQFPHHIALHCPERQVTYAELDSEIDKVAGFLIQNNITQGQRVPIIGHRSIELIVAQLGVIKSTACHVPIDARLPDNRKRNIIDQCAAEIVLVTDSDDATDCAVPKRSIKAILEDPSSAAPLSRMPTPEDVVYVIFTSGTTGQPKGVEIEHHSLLNLIEWHNEHFAMTSDCRSTLMVGVGFDVSQWEIWAPLCAGATLYILPDEIRSSVPELHDFYCEHLITHAYVPTVLVSELIRHPHTSNLVLQYLFTAGEKLPSIETQDLNYRLVDYYGPTEATIYTTCRVFDQSGDHGVSSIGFPVADTQVFILDEKFESVSAGSIGELYISGQCLARGYLSSPELTAQRFITLPPLNLRAYRTGDLARFLPDGSVQYLGRNDDQLKIRGYRIEPGDVEAALLRQPGVKTAVVWIDTNEGPAGKRLIAFVVATADTQANDLISALKIGMKKEVPDYMLPARYFLLDAIPCTLNGKTDKQALQARYAAASNDAPKFDIANETEARIAAIWQQHLGHADFTTDDDFFQIGGHSLMAAAVLRDISERLQAPAYIRDFYEFCSIKALAAELSRRRIAGAPIPQSEPVRALQDDINLPPTFAPADRFNEQQLTAPKHIMLTGATGFIGVHLLETLLRTTDAKIHCPVRAASPLLAQQRVIATLERYKIRLESNDLMRIDIFPADLSEPQLGLEQTLYARLCELIDVVHHSASAVNFIQPYSHMKKDNVEGLKQVIDFAAQGRLKPLILLSTISVYSWGHLHTGKTTMYEHDDIDQNLPAVVTDLGYVRSKWVMEKIADLAREKGLPLMTFRLGYATCDSRTGEFAGYQWWSRLIQTCLAFKAIPALTNLREGLTTVDYICEAIGCICRNPLALGKKFNLIPSPEKNLTLEDFFARLETHCGLNFARLPFNDWVDLWKTNPRAPLYPLSSLFRDKIVDNQSTVELYQNTYLWGCSNVQRFLEGSGIQEPEFNAKLLIPYLKKIQESPFMV